MTSLSLPPTPTLHNTFITNGHDSALWRAANEPSLLCPSQEMAAISNCTFKNDYRCSTAENTVNCQCSDLDIQREFNELGKRLTSASWELSQPYNRYIVAKIPQMVPAEFVLDFAHFYDTAPFLLRHDLCTIPNSNLYGCYRCSHGAQARVQCQANTEILGEIVCGTHAFVVPCGPQAPESVLRFHFDTARQFLNCSIQCGDTAHYFALSGILKYMGTFRTPFLCLIDGNSVTTMNSPGRILNTY
ncbi:hypothetical protein ANCDUO_22782 [Ancylostoma duodenale]|uniref:Phlebovirus glycoprotein G2 fusion domain-containing protein n=1 Tax=Ancylostoma duodenale TaxID=51022 RepID=A0A0C2BTC7_9BILA|nr:hypothetical protein ANCDUO_22782 [Ancylostoma duodenale]